MKYNLSFFERMKCSRDEKKEIIELIAGLISLSEKARKTGLLALEDDLAGINDYFFRKGLLLVIDGNDPAIVKKVLTILMLSSMLKGAELMKAAITIEGILSIQSGDNPGVVANKLSAFLGKDIDLWEEYNGTQKQENENHSILPGDGGKDELSSGEIKNKMVIDASAGEINFEKLAEFQDIYIQKILRETDAQDLAKAMKGCCANVASKIYSNMSERAGRLLKEDIDYMGPVRLEDVVQSQEKILNIANKLAQSGEIIIPDGREVIE